MFTNLDDMKAHLNVTFNDDDALILSKIDAAQSLVEAELGYALSDRYTELADVPAALVEAARQTAAHLYENRESIGFGSPAIVPYSTCDIIRNFRDWSFGDG